MIRPLRQRHRGIVLALGMFLPLAFAAGIAARKPAAETRKLPTELAPVAATFDAEEWSRADVFPQSPVIVRLLRGNFGAGKFAVSLSAAKDFVRPDLLVYWSAGNVATTNGLPDNAVLMGAFASPQLPVPAAAENADGALFLFSLADNEVVDVSKPIRFNNSTK